MFLDQVNNLLGHNMLNEGSNIRTGKLKTEPVNFVKAKKNKYTTRKDFVETMSIGFKMLNDEFKKRTKQDLWETSFKDCTYGTSKPLFNNEGSKLDEELKVDEFTRDVQKIGDVNIAVDQKKLQSLYSFMTKLKKTFNQALRASLKESKCDLTLEELRIKNLGDQHRVITSWVYETPHQDKFTTQVVFEGHPFKNGKPNSIVFEMSQANYKDMVKGIGGLYHKKLLSSVLKAASMKENVLVAFNPKEYLKGNKTFLAKNKKPITKIATRDFDRGLGMIQRYVPLMQEDGTPCAHAGKKVYRKVYESETFANSSLEEAMKYAFNPIISELADNKEVFETKSFCGLVDACNEYFTGKHSKKRKKVVNGFINSFIFGEAPMDIENFAEDWDMKKKLVNELCKLHEVDMNRIEEDRKAYYEKYYKKPAAKSIYNRTFMNEKTRQLVNKISKYS